MQLIVKVRPQHLVALLRHFRGEFRQRLAAGVKVNVEVPRLKVAGLEALVLHVIFAKTLAVERREKGENNKSGNAAKGGESRRHAFSVGCAAGPGILPAEDQRDQTRSKCFCCETHRGQQAAVAGFTSCGCERTVRPSVTARLAFQERAAERHAPKPLTFKRALLIVGALLFDRKDNPSSAKCKQGFANIVYMYRSFTAVAEAAFCCAASRRAIRPFRGIPACP